MARVSDPYSKAQPEPNPVAPVSTPLRNAAYISARASAPGESGLNRRRLRKELFAIRGLLRVQLCSYLGLAFALVGLRYTGRMPLLRAAAILGLLLAPSLVWAGETDSSSNSITATEPAISESLCREARAAVDRSCTWLINMQNDDGHWSSSEFPALTALPVWGLVLAGHIKSESVRKGTEYILTCVQKDGSIWRQPSETRKGGGLSNYNTALCMVALHATDRTRFSKVVMGARNFLSRAQHTSRDKFQGGMGYDADTGRPYADLSNSYIAYEAMKLTADLRMLEDEHPSADLDWDAARAFVASLQNDDGGFIYKPGQSMAGADTNKTGEVTFRSYGSMTYAGLLSLVYADVDKNDPRVKSAFDWATTYWTLEENPGMGLEGLFYFYNVLTKALSVYDADKLTLPGGKEISWRSEIIRKIVNLQKIDPADGSGYWANEASRWMEADPVLVTAYAVIALLVALGE